MPYANGVFTFPAETAPVERLKDRLNEPEVAEALNQLLDNIELIAFSVAALDGFLRRGDEIADNVADSLAEVKLAGAPSEATVAELVATLSQLRKTAATVKSVVDSVEFSALVQSGIFAPKMVGLVGQAANAMLESYEEFKRTPPVRPNPIALIKSLFDPDVQRTFSFLVGFARKFSQKNHA